MQKERDIWKFYAETPKKIKKSSWRGGRGRILPLVRGVLFKNWKICGIFGTRDVFDLRSG